MTLPSVLIIIALALELNYMALVKGLYMTVAPWLINKVFASQLMHNGIAPELIKMALALKLKCMALGPDIVIIALGPELMALAPDLKYHVFNSYIVLCRTNAMCLSE